jgi:hypothetical protein
MRPTDREGRQPPAERCQPVHRTFDEVDRGGADDLLQAENGLFAGKREVLRPPRSIGAIGVALDGATDAPDRLAPAKLGNDQTLEEELPPQSWASVLRHSFDQQTEVERNR